VTKQKTVNKTRKRAADRRTLSDHHRKRSASATHPPKQLAPPAPDASGFQPNPHRFYRVARLAELYDVDRVTIWRWRKSGVLPPFAKVGSIEGLYEAQLPSIPLRSAASA
jgi:hypothetical protein